MKMQEMQKRRVAAANHMMTMMKAKMSTMIRKKRPRRGAIYAFSTTFVMWEQGRKFGSSGKNMLPLCRRCILAHASRSC
jgi:hypothetical protein